MANRTPPINTLGIFTVLAPFNISSDVYRCASIQNIQTLADSSLDVFAEFYSPLGISESIYLDDLANQINIVTLVSKIGPELIIPSSYIDTFPDIAAIAYSDMYISINLGSLPDHLTLTNLLAELQTISTNYIGNPSVVELYKIASLDQVSAVDSVVLEATRIALVSNVVSETRGKDIADAELIKAKVRIALLEELLRNLSV